MDSLNIDEAAEFLKIHPVTLQSRAKQGEIPGAKIGRSWVFLAEDLADYIRSKYHNNGKRIAQQEGEQSCSLKEQDQITGILNFQSKAKQYTDLLAPQTKRKRSR